MKEYKEYSNLYQLCSKSNNKLMIPFFVFLSIVILAFPTLMVDELFGLAMVMLLMIIPTIMYAILWPILASRTKKSLKAFTPQQLRMIDSELPSREKHDGMVVTSQAVIATKPCAQLIPLESVLWVYKNVTVTRLNGIIPVHKDTMLMIADRNHKKHGYRIKNKGNAFELVAEELLRYKQDIIFGFENGMDDIYKKDINRLIAFSQECAEKRQNQAQ